MKQVIFFIENEERRDQSGICKVLNGTIFLSEYLSHELESKWVNIKCILIKQNDVLKCNEYPKEISDWDIVLIDDSTIEGIPASWRNPDKIGVVHHTHPEVLLSNISKDFPYKNKKKGRHEEKDPVYGLLQKLLLSYKDGVDVGFNEEKYKAALKAILDLFPDKLEAVLAFLHGCLSNKPTDYEWDEFKKDASMNEDDVLALEDVWKKFLKDIENEVCLSSEYNKSLSTLRDELLGKVLEK